MHLEEQYIEELLEFYNRWIIYFRVLKRVNKLKINILFNNIKKPLSL